MSPFLEIEHTADWSLRVWASTLPALFVDAAQGMYALAGARAAPGEAERTTIVCQGEDYESLLVSWLQEWLYRTEMDNQVFETFEIDRLTPTELTGSAVGRPAGHLDKLIKAVTYHKISVEKKEGLWRAEVIFDI